LILNAFPILVVDKVPGPILLSASSCVVFLTFSTVRTAHIKEEANRTIQPIDLYTEAPRGLPGDGLESDKS